MSMTHTDAIVGSNLEPLERRRARARPRVHCEARMLQGSCNSQHNHITSDALHGFTVSDHTSKSLLPTHSTSHCALESHW